MGSRKESVIKELAELYKTGGVKTIRTSLTLNEKDSLRIDKIAARLKVSKHELITTLLLAALDDLEAEVNKDTDI